MTPPTETRAVLIVDDEPAVRMVARAALAAGGYGTAEAADAEGARAAVRTATRPFDLILLDLTLPDANGADLIPEFRKLAPGTRILLVTGMHADDVADLHADGFLSKPFNRASLVAAVRRVLGG